MAAVEIMFSTILWAVPAFIRDDPARTSGPTSVTIAKSDARSSGELQLQVRAIVCAPRRRAYSPAAMVKGVRQAREVVLGDGYGSQNSLRQHFGLGEAQAVDELTVKWPRSGIVQTFHNVAGNRIIEVTEGRPELIEKHYRRVDQ